MKNTTLCYLEKNGAYLLLHRITEENDVNQGKWIGIGGHFEEGESPYDCAIREVYEETGLALAEARYRGVVTFVSDLYETEQMHLFTSSAFVGEERACDEGVAAWIPKEEIPSLPLWKGDLIFLSLLEKEEPFFSLKLVYRGDELTEAVLNGIPMTLSPL